MKVAKSFISFTFVDSESALPVIIFDRKLSNFGQENEYFVYSLFNFESIYKMYKVQIT